VSAVCDSIPQLVLKVIESKPALSLLTLNHHIVIHLKLVPSVHKIFPFVLVPEIFN